MDDNKPSHDESSADQTLEGQAPDDVAPEDQAQGDQDSESSERPPQEKKQRRPLPKAAPGEIDPELVEPAAVEVVRELREHDFEAYLVGGCVRDLLLGLTPKDFDVATNATPEEVRKVFRRSRTVGRRFRIVHVRVGRQLFEVSTYRKNVDEDDFPDDVTTSEDGVILRDNSYGTLEDDTFRRDFTVNAMYYDPLDGSVLDLAGGREDLAAKRLRLIGEPALRLREDPVRILRAVRFAAKLGFEIDQTVQDAIPNTAELLTAIPPARLFDEMNKLFLAGTAERVWELMCEFELAPILFPATNPDDGFVKLAMVSTDGRIAEEKPVTPGFLYAVLLWDDYQARITENALQQPMQEAETNAAIECIREQQLTISIPRRFSQFVRDVWSLQPRLERRQKKNLSKMLSHPKFRAAYDFLLLRAEMELVEQEAADFWTEIQETHEVVPRPDPDDDYSEDGESRDGNSRRSRSGGRSGGRSRNRRGRGGKGQAKGNGGNNGNKGNQARGEANGNVADNAGNQAPRSNTKASGDGEAAPKKKRRRRRRPRRRGGPDGAQKDGAQKGGGGNNDQAASSGNSGDS